ncbi:hypothetical protein [Polyangium sp. y55x31]|uniref:hypothetical protein n=1 Tax=Polyangium sp. y55x31 TaxID=3042688 RepID=UPI0024827421|nr:hypothetical protein [Polyangium sp. y55x31]MDI1477174.1 hypothetical protein [Polyangium sp. y55x31]
MRNPTDLRAAASAGASIAAAAIQQPLQTPAQSPAAAVQALDFAEALYQTQPLVPWAGRETAQAAQLVAESTARVRGLLPETAYRMVTSPRDLFSFITGPHPSGKTAEIVVAAEFRDLHAGAEPRMHNGPRYVSSNVVDVRLSPDTASRRDLLFQVRTRDGVLTVAGGQVKTGSGQYVSESLIKMAQTSGYGRTGYVDARFVNLDGSPRIAPDAFTANQAQRLREAGVQLRGILDLEERARLLVENIVGHGEDGLDPVAREELVRLRDDIAAAYGLGGVADRAVGSAASAAATSALVSLMMQAASGGRVDMAQVAHSAAGAAVWGAGSVAADALVYEAATGMGLAPEVARAVAQRTVAVGCCVIGVVSDALAEANAVREGRATVMDALSAGAFKTTMGLLPLVMPALGVGVPVLAAVQIGGRWALAALRNSEASLARTIAEDFEVAAALEQRMERMGETISHLQDECKETDRLFERVMGPARNRQLRLVK